MRKSIVGLVLCVACGGGGGGGGSSVAKVSVSIDASKTYQTWRAWGSMSQRWDSPHMYYGPNQGPPIDRVPAAEKEKILDVLYRDLRLDWIELPIKGGAIDPSLPGPTPGWLSHEIHNDNADPFDMDWSQFDFAWWDGAVPIVLGAFARIQARGETPIFSLRVGALEGWMTHDGALDVEEYAEWVCAVVLYLRETYNLTPTWISVMNEPDGMGDMSATTMALAVAALENRLAGLGLPGRVAAVETVTPAAAPAYLQALAGVIGSVAQIRYHIYDNDASVGLAPNLPARNAIRDFAALYGVPTAVTEMGSDVKQNRRTFWNDTPEQALAHANDYVNEMVEGGVSSLIMTLNFWTNSSPYFGTDAFAILNFDEQNAYAYQGFKRPVIYGVLGEFINNIRPGMVRVEAKSDDPSVRVVCFTAPGRTALVVVNNGTADKDVRTPDGLGGVVPAKGVKAFVR